MDQCIRPILSGFDPVDLTIFSDSPKLESCGFLEDAIGISSPDLGECIVYNPLSKDVPWPTAFPAVAQSLHWQAAENAGANLVRRILAAPPEDAKTLPANFTEKYQKELIEASVIVAIYAFPGGTEQATCLITQGNALIYLHDDVAESSSNSGMSILDQSLRDVAHQGPDGKKTWTNAIFRRFYDECVEEDPLVGPKLAYGVLSYARATRQGLQHQAKWDSFQEYMAYRTGDIADEFCFTALMLSSGVFLGPSDMSNIGNLCQLFIRYLALTNDLYSYNKEYYYYKHNKDALVNGVHVLGSILNLTPAMSKVLTRILVRDLERQIDDEYRLLIGKGELKPNQLRYARAMLVSCAGTLFSWSIAPRYSLFSSVMKNE